MKEFIFHLTSRLNTLEALVLGNLAPKAPELPLQNETPIESLIDKRLADRIRTLCVGDILTNATGTEFVAIKREDFQKFDLWMNFRKDTVPAGEKHSSEVDPGFGHDDQPGAAVLLGIDPAKPGAEPTTVDGKIVEPRIPPADPALHREHLKSILRKAGKDFPAATRTSTLEKMVEDLDKPQPPASTDAPPAKTAKEKALEIIKDTEAKKQAVPPAGKAASEMTPREQARAALVDLSASKGQDVAIGAMKAAVGVEKLSDVTDENLGKVVDACRARMTEGK